MATTITPGTYRIKVSADRPKTFQTVVNGLKQHGAKFDGGTKTWTATVGAGDYQGGLDRLGYELSHGYSAEYVTVERIDATPAIDRTALEAERAALVARLAEIDALLA